MAATGLREISGVCTHPDYQGRGYARRLMTKLRCARCCATRRPSYRSCAIMPAPMPFICAWDS